MALCAAAGLLPLHVSYAAESTPEASREATTSAQNSGSETTETTDARPASLPTEAADPAAAQGNGGENDASASDHAAGPNSASATAPEASAPDGVTRTTVSTDSLSASPTTTSTTTADKKASGEASPETASSETTVAKTDDAESEVGEAALPDDAFKLRVSDKTMLIVRDESNGEKIFQGVLEADRTLVLEPQGPICVVSPTIETVTVEIDGNVYATEASGLRRLFFDQSGPMAAPPTAPAKADSKPTRTVVSTTPSSINASDVETQTAAASKPDVTAANAVAAESTSAAAPEGESGVGSTAESVPTGEQGATATSAASATHSLTLHASGDTAVIVRQEADGEKIFSGKLKAGDTVTLERVGIVRVVSPMIENVTIGIGDETFRSSQSGLRQLFFDENGPIDALPSQE